MTATANSRWRTARQGPPRQSPRACRSARTWCRARGPAATGSPPRGCPSPAAVVAGEGPRRHRLAAWVTHPQNPYFARATVNRVWALLFGRPLVSPVDNLEPDGPIPAALQILADDFTAHHFDLRRLIRVIASTQVFRLDSATNH